MAESGLRPAESLLNNRSRRHVLRLMSLPKGNQAKSLPQLWGNGWSTSASTPDGWKRYSCRRRANGTRRQHLHRRGGLPTGASALDGRVSERERGGGVRGDVEEGTELGREEGPHGILSGGIRYGVRRHCARALAVAAERSKRHKLGRVRIFTDAQAAITRMMHNEPGPGQTYALSGDSNPARAGAFSRD